MYRQARRRGELGSGDKRVSGVKNSELERIRLSCYPTGIQEWGAGGLGGHT